MSEQYHQMSGIVGAIIILGLILLAYALDYVFDLFGYWGLLGVAVLLVGIGVVYEKAVSYYGATLGESNE